MSDRDVDAQFADIIAHWDDVAPLPDRGPDAPQTNEAPPAAEDSLGAVPGVDDDGPRSEPGELPGEAPPPARPMGINPSPLAGSIPVWRGATSGAGPGADAIDGTDALDGTGASSGDDEDEHFQPGPTAPLPPQEDIHFWGIVVGLVGGPLLLLWLVIFRPDVSDWWVLGALGLTVMGFVLLVLRQPHSRDEDDPDNGARV
jgi:hypothetical protein